MKRTRASWVVLLWGPALAMDAAAQEIVGDPSSSLVYTPVTPCRVVDTRRSGDPGEVGALQVGERRQWDVRGFNFAFQGGDSNCGELDQGRAYALSITAVGFANNGSVKVSKRTPRRRPATPWCTSRGLRSRSPPVPS